MFIHDGEKLKPCLLLSTPTLWNIRVAQLKHVSTASAQYNRYWNVHIYVAQCT